MRVSMPMLPTLQHGWGAISAKSLKASDGTRHQEAVGDEKTTVPKNNRGADTVLKEDRAGGQTLPDADRRGPTGPGQCGVGGGADRAQQNRTESLGTTHTNT